MDVLRRRSLAVRKGCLRNVAAIFPGRIVAFWQAYSGLQQPQPYSVQNEYTTALHITVITQ
jgi:hypothetical protein